MQARLEVLQVGSEGRLQHNGLIVRHGGFGHGRRHAVGCFEAVGEIYRRAVQRDGAGLAALPAGHLPAHQVEHSYVGGEALEAQRRALCLRPQDRHPRAGVGAGEAVGLHECAEVGRSLRGGMVQDARESGVGEGAGHRHPRSPQAVLVPVLVAALVEEPEVALHPRHGVRERHGLHEAGREVAGVAGQRIGLRVQPPALFTDPEALPQARVGDHLEGVLALAPLLVAHRPQRVLPLAEVAHAGVRVARVDIEQRAGLRLDGFRVGEGAVVVAATDVDAGDPGAGRVLAYGGHGRAQDPQVALGARLEIQPDLVHAGEVRLVLDFEGVHIRRQFGGGVGDEVSPPLRSLFPPRSLPERGFGVRFDRPRRRVGGQVVHDELVRGPQGPQVRRPVPALAQIAPAPVTAHAHPLAADALGARPVTAQLQGKEALRVIHAIVERPGGDDHARGDGG